MLNWFRRKRQRWQSIWLEIQIKRAIHQERYDDAHRLRQRERALRERRHSW